MELSVEDSILCYLYSEPQMWRHLQLNNVADGKGDNNPFELYGNLVVVIQFKKGFKICSG